MVPDKFDMVDMGGIDLIQSQGVAVEGLYQRLVESITLCRYQCLYNWKFNGILIPPSYVEMVVRDGSVWINEGVNVDENDVIHVYSLGANLTQVFINSNGDYTPPSGYDGFNFVSVSVPGPILNAIHITENGSYLPEQGVDGFSSVTVAIPSLSSKYLLQDPLHYDFIGGYVAQGTWYVPDSTSRTDIYQVYSGKKYIIHLGSITGNRFRAGFFTIDPALATATVPGTAIVNASDPSPYSYGGSVMFSPPSDGFVAIGKTNQSVNGLITYLVEFDESN